MPPAINIHDVYAPFLRYFRTRRLRKLRHFFPRESCPKIVDLGGEAMWWEMVGYDSQITLVNIRQDVETGACRLVVSDACFVGLKDKAFSLAFSNSVIEHLETDSRQRLFASEMCRLSEQIYCQTPNRWFPVEPHVMGVFLHWIPVRFRPYWLYRYGTLWGLVTRPSRERVEVLKREVRLLNKRKLKQLFPDCCIVTERFLGLPKSYAAVRSHDPGLPRV